MKYRKKPIIVDAFKWTGGRDQTEDPEWIVEALKIPQSKIGAARIYRGEYFYMEIKTKNGIIRVKPGSYIIRAENGDLSVYKGQGFKAEYELVEEGT